MNLLHQDKVPGTSLSTFSIKSPCLPKGEHLLRSLLPHGSLFQYILHRKLNERFFFFHHKWNACVKQKRKQLCKSPALSGRHGWNSPFSPFIVWSFTNLLICSEYLTLEGQGLASWGMTQSNHQGFLWSFRAIRGYVTAWLEMVMIYKKLVDN